jgi:hypothetical protein
MSTHSRVFFFSFALLVCLSLWSCSPPEETCGPFPPLNTSSVSTVDTLSLPATIDTLFVGAFLDHQNLPEFKWILDSLLIDSIRIHVVANSLSRSTPLRPGYQIDSIGNRMNVYVGASYSQSVESVKTQIECSPIPNHLKFDSIVVSVPARQSLVLLAPPR